MRYPVAILALCCLSFCAACVPVWAQQATSQNLRFTRKDQAAQFGKNDYHPAQGDFYIYRNGYYVLCYNFIVHHRVRVVDLRDGYILYVKVDENEEYLSDTLRMRPSYINSIRFITHKRYRHQTGYSLKQYRAVWENESTPKSFSDNKQVAHTPDGDTSFYSQQVARLSDTGVAFTTLRWRTVNDKVIDPAKADKPPLELVRNGVWFTPSAASKINGLNLGLFYTNRYFNPVHINGINISTDFVNMVFANPLIALLYIDRRGMTLADTIPEVTYHLRGLSISGGGVLARDTKLEGAAFNGVIAHFAVANGLLVTAGVSQVDAFSGVIIGGACNRAGVGRGVQIGLWNTCKHLKGVQVGLWNVNGKRKLPIINWSF